MKATVLHAPRDIRVDEIPDPAIVAPTDALVRITAACVCGSDLWPYRGINDVPEPARIGHEFVGLVEEVGDGGHHVRPGDFVVAPFMYSDNTCPHCRAGIQSACATGGFWGGTDRDGQRVDGGQGEYARVPLADGTLVATSEVPSDDLVPSLLALSDVMGTGWHAAVAAGVQRGDTVVVVGDGAVGLCGVLSAAQLGAGRIVAMSRHASRQAIARRFGATDVVAERGDDAVAAVTELTDGVGADAVLECVGTGEAMTTAHPGRASGRDGGVRRRPPRRRAARPRDVLPQRRRRRRGRAGPRVPPDAARPRARRRHRPRGRLRPRGAARRGGGGLRRHGRAARDQVPDQDLTPVTLRISRASAGWSSEWRSSRRCTPNSAARPSLPTSSARVAGRPRTREERPTVPAPEPTVGDGEGGEGGLGGHQQLGVGHVVERPGLVAGLHGHQVGQVSVDRGSRGPRAPRRARCCAPAPSRAPRGAAGAVASRTSASRP